MVKVSLNEVSKVKEFVSDISKLDINVSLVSGGYKVNAKSILGVFSLDLSKPVSVITESTNPSDINTVYAACDKYLV
jgi:phosphotransferase system HPr-like phosphotransfer protein